jgi:argininosuccinate lyase
MKLWQKNTNVNERIDSFTVGRDRELDLELAPFDILGSLAHIRMLASVGLLEKEEERQLRATLQRLHQETTDGGFTIDPGMEDVHSQVEFLLTKELGDMGKKIHSGRSRNDQVLVDLRLYFRDQLKEVVFGMEALFAQLQSLSEEHKDVLLPGYTHLQVAMPSSFGLWFGAYAENLTDDLTQMLSTYRIINQDRKSVV